MVQFVKLKQYILNFNKCHRMYYIGQNLTQEIWQELKIHSIYIRGEYKEKLLTQLNRKVHNKFPKQNDIQA